MLVCHSPLLPGIDNAGEFAEVDFRVEIGGEIFAVAAGIDIDDVDIGDLVEIFVLGQLGIGIDDARIEARAEDGGDALFLAFGGALPFVIAVPWRRFADLVRLFVDRRVDIGDAGIHAGAQHRHVEEGGADIDDDLGRRST